MRHFFQDKFGEEIEHKGDKNFPGNKIRIFFSEQKQPWSVLEVIFKRTEVWHEMECIFVLWVEISRREIR